MLVYLRHYLRRHADAIAYAMKPFITRGCRDIVTSMPPHYADMPVWPLA